LMYAIAWSVNFFFLRQDMVGRGRTVRPKGWVHKLYLICNKTPGIHDLCPVELD
jgi:hypothetical protein